jgi:hypothetical protein
MKTLRWLLIICLGGAVLAGCATVPMASVEQDLEAKSFTPSEGKANLYIARSNTYFGYAITFRIMVDGIPIGSIGPGTYHLLSIEPGQHNIIVSSNENSDQIIFEASADRNYYFRVLVLVGLLTARAGLEPLDEVSAQLLVMNGKRALSIWDF